MESVFAVGGPELGRRNDFIKQLRARCQAEWKGDPEEHRIYANETPVSALLDLLMNGSLFSPGKFVQYLGADQIKAKADVQALVEYAKRPAESTVLVLIADGFGVDKAIEAAIGKDAKKVFWELSAQETGRWVRDFFATQGIRADDEAVDAILDLVENNTEALRTECSRLALFFSRGSTIVEDDVERYIAHNRAEDAFSLFDKMASGSFEQSLDTLSAILSDRDGSGIGLLAGLLWSFRRLSSLHAALSAGDPFEQAARSLRITRRSALASYDSARRRWPRNTCERLVAFGVDTDARLRAMGQSNEKVLLELFVYACVVVKGPVPLGRA
ncbi:MAG: DNA polymerase III subunit delta [Spirochaetae bacterium HGW-Spirochaetae-3]|jgi:DNA polymerase-3 subunit delta|nr:MAG: DNA polymerase III subunit delta [Spirochaetae bacterium HGW-Spirochaetae-3]